MSFHDFVEEPNMPEPAESVNEPQVPGMRPQWSFNTNVVIAVVLGVLGVSFAVWFLIQFAQAKAKATLEAASDES